MVSAARLAWLQLRRQKVRLVVAVAGVGFAVVLMFMQIGFQDALFRSSVNVHQSLRADLVLTDPTYTFVARPTMFSRRRLYQALAVEGVASVTPVYANIASWKEPTTGRTRAIFALGVEPDGGALDVPVDDGAWAQLRLPDVVLYDRSSRPEFGPVPALFQAEGPVATEVNHRRIAVQGLFQLGTSFGVDGTILTSDLNFRRLFPDRPAGAIVFGLIRLVPGADPERVRAAVAAALPPDVRVLTKADLIRREVAYWATATPIGFVFAFGVAMGLVVGMIIVYQILFADISDHFAEYATLKAMGYSNGYLAGLVVAEATLLAAIGFVPAVALCVELFDLSRKATMLPMAVSPVRALQVLGLTLVMCWGSGLIAIRKLRTADPASVF